MRDSIRSIVLGSSSPYRRQLLQKLGLPFTTASPDIDEVPLATEAPMQLVTRLAEQKARAVAKIYPQALIIGSDQVAVLKGKMLGKPGSEANAKNQLASCSGNTVTFLTGLCLLDAQDNSLETICEPFEIQFRTLSSAQIERYIEKERPLDCAGSFKSEGLGIALFERMQGNDPNALIGLPLIQLINMLERKGILIP